MNEFWDNWQSRVLALLRIITGFLFLWHGTQKLFGFPPPSQSGQDSISGLLLIAGILEFVGGAFLILGLWTRWSAFILSGMMAVAYWMFFGAKSLLPIINGGEMAVLYCFVFFYLFFAGGGSWSLDGYIQKRRNETTA